MDYFRRPELFETLHVNTNIEYVLPSPLVAESSGEPMLMIHGGPCCSCTQNRSLQTPQKVLDQDLFHLIDSYCCEEVGFDIETENVDCVQDVVDFLCDCCETEEQSPRLTFDTEKPNVNPMDERFLNSVQVLTDEDLSQEKLSNSRKYDRHFGEKAVEETVKNTVIHNGVCSSGFSSLWLSPGNSARNL